MAICDPALFVSVVIWNEKEAWFTVNNPSDKDITTTFATAPTIKGCKGVSKQITLKAGTTLDVKD